MSLLEPYRTSLQSVTATCCALTFASCFASTGLPPRISDEQRKAVAATHLPFSVGVARYRFPAYSEHLTMTLQRTRLFARVDRLEAFASPPDLVARVDRRIYGNAIVPFATGLTLGLVPTSTDEQWGESFSLTAPGGCRELVRIEHIYVATTTLGCASIFRATSPDVTLGDPEKHYRYSEGLAAAIIARADDINGVAMRCPSSPP